MAFLQKNVKIALVLIKKIWYNIVNIYVDRYGIPLESKTDRLKTAQKAGKEMNMMNQDPSQKDLGNFEEPPTQQAPQPKESFGHKVASNLFDAMEMFALAVFAVVLLFTFGVRHCRVDGESMENTLHVGEMLLISSFAYTPKQDDIIVFHMTEPLLGLEKPLVKRVIATAGQKVEINFKTCEITVDGVKYADEHKVLKNLSDREIGYYQTRPNHHYSPETGIFSATVPEGCIFVLGDNRNNSTDSRLTNVGFVDERTVLGKVIFRFSPFTLFP